MRCISSTILFRLQIHERNVLADMCICKTIEHKILFSDKVEVDNWKAEINIFLIHSSLKSSIRCSIKRNTKYEADFLTVVQVLFIAISLRYTWYMRCEHSLLLFSNRNISLYIQVIKKMQIQILAKWFFLNLWEA